MWGEPLVLVVYYRPPGSEPLSSPEWLCFLSQFNGRKVIFGGDFNSHHVGWGFPLARVLPAMPCGMRFMILIVFCSTMSLLLSLATLTVLRQSSTYLLLTVLWPLSWRVGNDSWGSDYFPIFVSSELRPDTSLSFRRSTRSYSVYTDWKAFQRLVNEEVRRLSSEIPDVEVLYTIFVSLVVGALEAVTPGRPSSRRHGSSIFRPSCFW